MCPNGLIAARHLSIFIDDDDDDDGAACNGHSMA